MNTVKEVCYDIKAKEVIISNVSSLGLSRDLTSKDIIAALSYYPESKVRIRMENDND